MVNIINKARALVQSSQKKIKKGDAGKSRNESLLSAREDWAMSADAALRASTMESYK